MITSITLLILGIWLLLWSAEGFVVGASKIAKQFKISPFIIGLTIVAIGTSLPEALVSITSAAQGAPEAAIGNVFGSNIANIALILGVCAIIAPIAIKSKILKQELPILLILTIITYVMLWDLSLTKLKATILVLINIPIIIFIAKTSKSSSNSATIDASGDDSKNSLLVKFMPWVWLIIGIVVLPISSNLLVTGALGLARELGASDLIIGLIVMALGTSLPELASSVISAIKGKADMALGNVIGSNIFNLTIALGPAGIICPTILPKEAFYRDVTLTLILTIVLFLMMLSFKKSKPAKISKLKGILLLLVYVGYIFVVLKT